MVRENAPRGGGTPVAERLDWESIARAVDGRTIGRRIVYRERTGSTNDDAKRLAAAGEPEGTVVLTDAQTAGRGRAGKSRWMTPHGTSIAVSIVLRPRLAPERLGALAMVSGLAAVDALREACAVRAALKWPNDVLVAERKLGGILVESALSGASLDYAVIGIGLNGNLPPAALGPLPDAALPPTSLLDVLGHAVSREAVIVALLEALGERYAAAQSRPPGELTDAFRAALETLGRPVRLTAGAEAFDGVAEDVTDSGALVIRTPDGTQRVFSYGEMTLRDG